MKRNFTLWFLLPLFVASSLSGCSKFKEGLHSVVLGSDWNKILHFDFGTQSSLRQLGSRRVTPQTRYTHGGHGWLGDAEISAVDRGQGDAVDRDLNLSKNAVFRVDVPNGLYDVTLRVGDSIDHGRGFVSVEGKLVGQIGLRRAGVFETLTTEVRVQDGNLDVQIGEMGQTRLKDILGDAIINGLSIHKRDLPGDPVRWELHASGNEFRRITDAESVANHWPVGSYLVRPKQDIYDGDRSSARLIAPLDDDNVLDLAIPLIGPEPELTIVKLGFGVPSSQGHYSMLRYELPKPKYSGPSCVLIADPVRSGFWASIITSENSPLGVTSYVVKNGESSWLLDSITPDDGSTPSGQQLYLVSPGESEISGIMAPPTDDAFNFALIGEIKWCTANSTGWGAALAARALNVRQGFANCAEDFTIGGQCVNSTDVDLVQRVIFCNITSSQETAANCANGISCPTNQFGHEYSYFGCNNEAACYMNHVRENLLQARDEGHFVPELHLAQVVHHQMLKLIAPGVPDDTIVSICGRGAFPGGVAECEGGAADWPGGVSAAADDAPDCPLETSTHEFGHNFGGVHDGKNVSYAGMGGCTGTVMESGPGKCNVFSINNATTLADCALVNASTLDYASQDWCEALTEVATVDCPNIDDGVLIPAP